MTANTETPETDSSLNDREVFGAFLGLIGAASVVLVIILDVALALIADTGLPTEVYALVFLLLVVAAVAFMGGR